MPDWQKTALAAPYLIWQIVGFVVLTALLWFLPLMAVQRAVIFYAKRRGWPIGISLVTLIFFDVALCLLLLATNACIYPGSSFADFVPEVLIAVPVFVYGFIFICMALIFLSTFVFSRKAHWLLAVMLGLFFAIFFSQNGISKAGGHDNQQPNVIVIGIDSFSPEHIRQYHAGNFSQFTNLLDGFFWFQQSVTQIPRTFGAWVTILTGKQPVSHGARFNLVPLSDVRREMSIAYRFRDAGYRAIFSMDERLFSNIDESFGFDNVVGPRYGAIDFVLSQYSDLPFNNVLMSVLPFGEYFFPSGYANRATKGSYLPEHHDGRLRRVVRKSSDKPLFLVAHFCLPHYPYRWGGRPELDDDSGLDGNRLFHAAGIRAASRQVTNLLSNLESEGYLKNAIVVLLSDHGHQLYPVGNFSLSVSKYVGQLHVTDDVALRAYGNINGHGNNVFDPVQTNVFFAVKVFGKGKGFSPGKSTFPAAMVDVAPTILNLSGIAFDKEEFDGMSLAPIIHGSRELDGEWLRPRYIESDAYFSSLKDINRLDRGKLLAETLSSYRVSAGYPMVELRNEVMSEQILGKVRSVIIGDWQLAFLPETQAEKEQRESQAQGSRSFVLLQRSTGLWTNDEQSELFQRAPVSAMFRCLQTNYAKELPFLVQPVAASGGLNGAGDDPSLKYCYPH